MYSHYLKYVENYLKEHNGDMPSDPRLAFRSKFHHTVRVLGWTKRLAEGRDNIDRDVLYTAAIFHDIGYSGEKSKSHAELGAKAFHEYTVKRNLEPSFSEKVENIIRLHSSKELLKADNVPLELIILMEADLLDEEGALRVAWYSMDKGITGAGSYKDVYQHIIMGSNKRLVNPMVTEKARFYWDEKQKLVNEFTKQLNDDIMTGTEFL